MGHWHNQMDILSAAQVERVYQVTDLLDLHRDWVVVPLNAAAEGMEMEHPDGKLLIRPAAGEGFEPWLRGLRGRLEGLHLGRVPRRQENDPKFPLTAAGENHPVGTRGYLGRLGELH